MEISQEDYDAFIRDRNELNKIKEAVEPELLNDPGNNWLAVLLTKADNLTKIIQELGGKWIQSKKTDVRFKVYLGFFALGFVIIIVGSMLYLTVIGRVDGSTFAFLMGTIVGYVLTYLQDNISS